MPEKSSGQATIREKERITLLTSGKIIIAEVIEVRTRHPANKREPVATATLSTQQSIQRKSP